MSFMALLMFGLAGYAGARAVRSFMDIRRESQEKRNERADSEGN